MLHSQEISRPDEVIKKGYLPKLLVSLFCIFVIGAGVAALCVYFEINKSFDTHYSAILSLVEEIRETLVIKTIKINLIFSMLVSAGIVLLGILYTHRIAGPLYRIKLYAKTVREGRLDAGIKFRRKDAVHLFAEALNEMTKNCGEKVTAFSAEIEQLKAAVAGLESLTDQDREAALAKIMDIDDRIKKLLLAVRL